MTGWLKWGLVCTCKSHSPYKGDVYMKDHKSDKHYKVSFFQILLYYEHIWLNSTCYEQTIPNFLYVSQYIWPMDLWNLKPLIILHSMWLQSAVSSDFIAVTSSLFIFYLSGSSCLCCHPLPSSWVRAPVCASISLLAIVWNVHLSISLCMSKHYWYS